MDAPYRHNFASVTAPTSETAVMYTHLSLVEAIPLKVWEGWALQGTLLATQVLQLSHELKEKNLL